MALKEEFEYVGKPWRNSPFFVVSIESCAFICPLALGSALYHMVFKRLQHEQSPVRKFTSRLNMQTSSAHQSQCLCISGIFCDCFIFMYINPCLFEKALTSWRWMDRVLFVLFQRSDVHIVTSWTLRERPDLKHPGSPRSLVNRRCRPRPRLHHRLLRTHLFQVRMTLSTSRISDLAREVAWCVFFGLVCNLGTTTARERADVSELTDVKEPGTPTSTEPICASDGHSTPESHDLPSEKSDGEQDLSAMEVE